MWIKVNDRVIVSRPGYEEVIGRVEAFTPSVAFSENILLVRLKDGSLCKCLESSATVLPEETEPAPEHKDEITISRDDFKRAVVKAIDPKNFRQEATDHMVLMMIGMSGVVICSQLEKELFGDTEEK